MLADELRSFYAFVLKYYDALPQPAQATFLYACMATVNALTSERRDKMCQVVNTMVVGFVLVSGMRTIHDSGYQMIAQILSGVLIFFVIQAFLSSEVDVSYDHQLLQLQRLGIASGYAAGNAAANAAGNAGNAAANAGNAAVVAALNAGNAAGNAISN